MAMARFLANAAVASLLALGVVAESEAPTPRHRQKQPEPYQEQLLNWLLEDPTAFFHPSILWKRLGPDGTSGPYAMHATEDIPKGTPLIVLPRKYVLESHQEIDEEFGSEEWQSDPRMCFTVISMLDEYNKHKDPTTTFESFYWPILSYLFEDNVGGSTAGMIPASWSDPAMDILDLILSKQEDGSYVLEPAYDEFSSIFDICSYAFDENEKGIVVSELEALDAYFFLMQYGWYDKVLPVIGLLNHANGPARNVEITPIDDTKGIDFAAYAWRDIAEGEQLCLTYSECMDETCDFGKQRYNFLTQEIFGEYGFVEQHPQRWSFRTGDELEEEEHYGPIAEITTDPRNKDQKLLRWIFRTPDESDIAFIREQLARLKSIESSVREGVSKLETPELAEFHNIKHERETLLELYETYIEVYELALEHKDDPVAVTKESFEQEIEELRRLEGQMTIEKLRNHELLGSALMAKDDEL